MMVCFVIPSCSTKKSIKLDYSWIKTDKSNRWIIDNYMNIEYKTIKEEYKEKYINLLNENEYVIIDKIEFGEILEEYNEYNYVDKKHDTIKFNYENENFIIVRAVNKNYFHNNYNVLLTDENELFISHYAMGSKAYWIHKDAIILSLDKIPDEIYVNSYVVK